MEVKCDLLIKIHTVCFLVCRRYQNSIKPKMVQGLSIEYNAKSELEEIELGNKVCLND